MKKGYWDLTQLYKTNEDFLEDLKLCKKLANNLETFKGKLKEKDKNIILTFLKMESKFSMILEKLAVYSFCKIDDDGKDKTNAKNYALVNDFYSQTSEKLAFSKVELSSLDDEFLNLIKNDKDFTDYSRSIGEIIRDKVHTLSEKEEQQMASMSSFSNADDTFSMLSNVEMDHGVVKDENGKEIKLFPGNYNSLMNSKNPEFRQSVMETYYGSYAKLVNTFANLFSSHLKYENFVAKTYKFNSVFDMKCYGEEVSTKIMDVNIKEVSSHANLLREYFTLKKKLLNLKEFKTSDIGVEISNDDEKIDYDTAISDIKESYKVFGEEYVKMFEKAVNDGWIDAFPRENKKSGGYTTSVYTAHPFILLNYDGTLEWASAITHEFGHAMHSVYSAQNQPYPDADYTLFVAEIVSLTNEIIYNKYLLSKAKTKNEKIKLLSYFLQLFVLNVFDSSRLAEFENFVHDELQNGASLTAEDFNNKFIELAKKYYGDTVKFTKNYEFGWSRNGHLYRDFYLYKYSLGLSCACYVASRILASDGQDYLKKYKQFLSLGSSKDPIESLKVAEIDVCGNEIYKIAFDTFNSYLNELRRTMEEK